MAPLIHKLKIACISLPGPNISPDLISGVDVKKEGKHKTAFQIYDLSFYGFNPMPFGLSYMPARFQRLMEMYIEIS